MLLKHRHIPRLYIVSITDEFCIKGDDANHLNVFRLRVGNNFFAFNSNDGEWICEIVSITKKQVIAKRITHNRSYYPTSKLYIAFGIIKPDNMKLIIEKCTELGTTEFFPLTTDYSQYKNINISKLQTIATHASEQSERMDIPVIHNPIPLPVFVENLPSDVIWMSAIERFTNTTWQCPVGNVGFIVGTEGGFSDLERSLLIAKTVPVSLGKNILRAETACITCACLAMYANSI